MSPPYPRVDALGGPASVNLLLTGHSHFDHSFDTATWSRLTGARIIGSKTTCLQAMAEHLPADRCTPVSGGEKFALADGVTMRVVRWNHSGDPATNPEQHNPVELDAAPRRIRRPAGCAAASPRTFPTAAAIALSLHRRRPGWPFQLVLPELRERRGSSTRRSSSAASDYGAPIDNLKAAMKAAGLDSVDFWIGTGGLPIAQLVLPVIKPKAYFPMHWDGLWGAFEAGVPGRLPIRRSRSFWRSPASAGQARPVYGQVAAGHAGIRPIPNTVIKSALGFPGRAGLPGQVVRGRPGTPPAGTKRYFLRLSRICAAGSRLPSAQAAGGWRRFLEPVDPRDHRR